MHFSTAAAWEIHGEVGQVPPQTFHTPDGRACTQDPTTGAVTWCEPSAAVTAGAAVQAVARPIVAVEGVVDGPGAEQEEHEMMGL